MSFALRFSSVCVAAVLLCVHAKPARAGATLDAIRARGMLVCGVATQAPGVATVTSQGRFIGFHVDICRALAAALFADADKVRFVPLNSVTRFTAVQSGEIDVWEGTTAVTLSRDSTLGLSLSLIHI